MAIRRFVLQSINNLGSALNPAENVWRIEAGALTDAQIAAQIIGFTVTAMNHACGFSQLTAMLTGPDAGPLTSLPFPSTELTACNADVPTGFDCPVGDFGETFGNADELCPPGSSVLLTEYTALGGRHNGRKYLPWLCTIGTDSGGLMTGAARTGIAERYLVWILGTDPAGGPVGGAVEVLTAVVGAANSAVTSSNVSVTPARLRSRIN